MSASGSGCFISLVMALPLPLWLFAADTGAAILHTRGGVWVNGTEVADSTAIFPGDSRETKSGFVANLGAEGSSVLIQGGIGGEVPGELPGSGTRKRRSWNFYLDECACRLSQSRSNIE